MMDAIQMKKATVTPTPMPIAAPLDKVRDAKSDLAEGAFDWRTVDTALMDVVEAVVVDVCDPVTLDIAVLVALHPLTGSENTV
jgi:hypothetical protein